MVIFFFVYVWAYITGVIYPVWTDEELQDLDFREIGYKRIPIPFEKIDILHEGLNPFVQALTLDYDNVRKHTHTHIYMTLTRKIISTGKKLKKKNKIFTRLKWP